MEDEGTLLADLFDNAPCGYLVTRDDGVIIRINRTFSDLTGHSLRNLPESARFLELLTVPGRIYFETHVSPLLLMQGAVKEVAFEVARSDGSKIPVLVNASKTAQGNVSNVLIAVFDASDRRTYEKELLRARRLADEAAKAERSARESAEKASRVKDEFLAVVSHELRTPLNGILGWTQMLQGKDGLDKQVAEGLEVIARNARLQAQLIEDLLDMGRVISGKLRLDVQKVFLGEVVAAALDTAKPAADGRSIRLQKILDPTVTVSGDPGRLQQVFWNLLTNAIKFTPKDGSIRVVMQRINSHIEVSVSDSGQGMSKEFVAHAFERFSQSDAAEVRRTKGLGLGLSIVKTLVEMHGGSVSAASEGPGKGSTFTVCIPVEAVDHYPENQSRTHPAALLGTKEPQQDFRLRGLKILVVDDHDDARELLRIVLSRAGAEVVTASSVPEALQTVPLERPDILISDIGMPDFDGYELIRRLRMLGDGLGQVRAIALTAFTRLEDRTKAMLSGFQMHLAKPVDPHELVVTVATLAGR